MGTDKAMIEIAGLPMVSRIVSTVGSAGLEPVVVAKPDSPLPRLDCRVLVEPAEPRHPLTGLLAALNTSAGRGVVAIACDMPLVPARLLTWLAELEEEVAVCEVDGRLEPLLGRYSPTIADRLAARLTEGAALGDAIGAFDPYIVGEDKIARFGDPKSIVFNVNAPGDVERAEGLLKQTGRRIRALRPRLSRSPRSGEGS
jgi:molybdopterin-guanine dinucleotide biosynthesis protein A